MAAGVGDVGLQRRLVGALGFFEQPKRPQRVAVERVRRRVGGIPPAQALGVGAGTGKIADAQEHQGDAGLGAARQRRLRGRGRERAPVGVGRVAKARFTREQVAELDLDVGRSGRRRLRRERHQRRDDGRGERNDQRGLPHLRAI
jgi:hypothetical protein